MPDLPVFGDADCENDAADSLAICSASTGQLNALADVATLINQPQETRPAPRKFKKRRKSAASATPAQAALLLSRDACNASSEPSPGALAAIDSQATVATNESSEAVEAKALIEDRELHHSPGEADAHIEACAVDSSRTESLQAKVERLESELQQALADKQLLQEENARLSSKLENVLLRTEQATETNAFAPEAASSGVDSTALLGLSHRVLPWSTQVAFATCAQQESSADQAADAPSSRGSSKPATPPPPPPPLSPTQPPGQSPKALSKPLPKVAAEDAPKISPRESPSGSTANVDV
eukprot:6206891-Pleurochrysis_carterae.AAC.1